MTHNVAGIFDLDPRDIDRASALFAFEVLRQEVLKSHLAGAWETILSAARYANDAHHEGGKLEAYTGRPYVFHCVAVAVVALRHGRPLREVLAALLHDVIEDTSRCWADVAQAFGFEVAALVGECTTPGQQHGIARAERARLECVRLADISHSGQNVKLADIVVNASTIAARSPRFAAVYIPEKLAQIEVLTLGCQSLRSAATTAVTKGLNVLNSAAPR